LFPGNDADASTREIQAASLCYFSRCNGVFLAVARALIAYRLADNDDVAAFKMGVGKAV
jgi:hypothetical protein